MAGAKPTDPAPREGVVPPPAADRGVEARRRQIERGVYERRSNQSDGSAPTSKE